MYSNMGKMRERVRELRGGGQKEKVENKGWAGLLDNAIILGYNKDMLSSKNS